MYSRTIAKFFATACMLWSTASFADSPEVEAVENFYSYCLLTRGEQPKIEARLAHQISTNLAKQSPANRRFSNQASAEWMIRSKDGSQLTVLSLEKKTCVLRAAKGDAIIIKKEFEKAAQDFGAVLHTKPEPAELPDSTKVDSAAYQYDVKGRIRPTIILLSFKESNTSGVKHVLSFAFVRKD